MTAGTISPNENAVVDGRALVGDTAENLVFGRLNFSFW